MKNFLLFVVSLASLFAAAQPNKNYFDQLGVGIKTPNAKLHVSGVTGNIAGFPIGVRITQPDNGSYATVIENATNPDVYHIQYMGNQGDMWEETHQGSTRKSIEVLRDPINNIYSVFTNSKNGYIGLYGSRIDLSYHGLNTGFNAVTMNSNTQALGCTNCLAAGQNTIVRGNGAFGFGADGEANGNYSFIANDANFANAESSTAFGFGNFVNGQNGFAWGNNNKVDGADGLALGGNLWSKAYRSMTLGYGRTKVIQNPESNSVLITNESASIWIRQNGDIDITGNVKINGVAFNPAIAKPAQIPQEQPKSGKYMVMTTSGQLLYLVQIK